MAYDLRAGQRLEGSVEIGSIEYGEASTLIGLARKTDSFFLNRISDLFVDQTFSTEESGEALAHLLPLLTADLDQAERSVLTKLISALSYARWQDANLFCVCD